MVLELVLSTPLKMDQLVKNLESVVAKDPELNFIRKTDGNNALSFVRSNKMR